MHDVALQELAEQIGGRVSLGDMPPVAGTAAPVGKIVTDSRQVEPGDVFWALKGPSHDGADFAEEAFARGASGVVLAGRHVEPWAGRWVVSVDDPLRSLWQLAAFSRHRFAGTVIGVTGSVGKTTTREMIHQVLSSRLEGTASRKNYNNHVGLPLCMLEWNPLDDYALVELAASAPGEIAALADLCQPEIGVITRIGEAHLAGFGSVESVAKAKAELFSALPDDGWAVVGDDDAWLRRVELKQSFRRTRVGRSNDCDLVAREVRSADGWLTFRLDHQQFRVPVWGRHHLTSALLAVAVGQIMQLSLAEIAEALEQFQGPPQRCQVAKLGGVTMIDDTYNANPTSMRAALELLREIDCEGRRIVVCGDMAELGPGADARHRELGALVMTLCGAELLVACGEFADDVVSGARAAGMPAGSALACRTPAAALPRLANVLSPGDVLLVKGARCVGMEQIVAGLTPAPLSRAA